MKSAEKTWTTTLTRAMPILLAACVSFLSACNENGQVEKGERTVTITMSSADRFVVAGRRVDRKGLQKALKSAGAGAGTPVVISIPANATQAEIAALAKELARAGFRRIAFTRPRKIAINAKPE